MTKSNNEWVPEAGDVVEVFDTVNNRWNKVEITGVGIEVFIIKYYTNAESLLSKKATIRPIKTEAEKRREQMIEELEEIISNYSLERAAHNIIDEGWIKPKPLTDEVIEDLKNASNIFNIDVYIGDLLKRAESYIRGEDL